MNLRLERKLNEVSRKIDFNAPSFSFRSLRESAVRIAELHESNVESTFGFLLRSSIQEYANDVYNDLPVMYPNFVTEVQSKRRTEIYGGLYRPSLPLPVDNGEPFQDSSFKGFEREIINRKYGRLETFERELFDDDMTGQIKARAANLGEGARINEEIIVLSTLFGVTTTQEGVEIPASTYNSGTVYDNTNIGNRPVAFSRLSAASLEAAHVAMRKMTDPLGRKFLVVPTVLVVSPIDEFLAIALVNSPNQAWNSTGATSNLVNPLQGRYTVYSSPFIPEKAWLIGDPKRGLVFQRRDPLEITQENTQAGDSFRKEVYAFRVRERFGVDWVEARFAYLGDDGTV